MTGLGVTFLVAAFCILIAGLFAVIVERTEDRDEARKTVTRLGRELAASDLLVVELDAENMRLHAELTEAQIAAGTVRVPSLHVVREDSDYEWPAIVRAVEGEVSE